MNWFFYPIISSPEILFNNVLEETQCKEAWCEKKNRIKHIQHGSGYGMRRSRGNGRRTGSHAAADQGTADPA
jgi:hypothetical protein